jgi:hypothetical protein
LQKTGDLWDGGMEAEVEFQRVKRRKRMLFAGTENQLLPDERDAQFAEDYAAHVRHEAELHRKHERQHAARQQVLRGGPPRPALQPLMGSAAFCTDGVDIDAATLRQLRLQRVASRDEATLFVAGQQGVGEVGQRVQWHAVLRGCRVASPLFLRSRGATGDLLTYKAAVGLAARRLWCSPLFAERHPTLSHIIDVALRCPSNRWTLLEGTAADFKTAVGRVANRTTCAVIGLVTPRCRTSCAFLRACPVALTADEFIAYLACLDRQQSTACGALLSGGV